MFCESKYVHMYVWVSVYVYVYDACMRKHSRDRANFDHVGRARIYRRSQNHAKMPSTYYEMGLAQHCLLNNNLVSEEYNY